jgi:hypothetical protein
VKKRKLGDPKFVAWPNRRRTRPPVK